MDSVEPIEIRGTAHPPPARNGVRHHPADFSGAEIAGTNMHGKPLLNEHDHGDRAGTILATWQGTDGSLRRAAQVTDPQAINDVRNGTLRGLSLGTDMILGKNNDVAARYPAECSLCVEGKRPGTWVDTIDGKQVLSRDNASKASRESACSSANR